MEKRFRLNLLLDFYGALLTPHACELMRMYLEEDLSLQEIADNFGISRQAVHDSVSRSEKQLIEYEEKLGALERFRGMKSRLDACRAELEGAKAALDRAENLLSELSGM